MHPDVKRVGHYATLRMLAEGMYTVVYEARHTHPNFRDRPLTLRVLRHPRHANYFLRTAQFHAALDHPRISALYDVDGIGGQAYSARKYIDGDDLLNGIKSARRSIEEVARIVSEAAEAIDHAHSKGVIHGYVHPRHLLTAKDGATSVVGFGEWPPPADCFHGNPLHLAPEQLEADGQVTPATDVYGLCETAIWLLSGRHPFDGIPPADLLQMKMIEQLCQPVQELLSGTSRVMKRVLVRGLAANPVERYGTATEFANAFVSAGRDGKHQSRWRFW